MSDDRPHRGELDRLSPEARRVVLEAQLSAAEGRMRDLLAAAAGGDRDAVAQLAAALDSDLAGLNAEEAQAAARALAELASGDAPLGAGTLALTRAFDGVLARFRRRAGPASSP